MTTRRIVSGAIDTPSTKSTCASKVLHGPSMRASKERPRPFWVPPRYPHGAGRACGVHHDGCISPGLVTRTQEWVLGVPRIRVPRIGVPRIVGLILGRFVLGALVLGSLL